MAQCRLLLKWWLTDPGALQNGRPFRSSFMLAMGLPYVVLPSQACFKRWRGARTSDRRANGLHADFALMMPLRSPMCCPVSSMAFLAPASSFQVITLASPPSLPTFPVLPMTLDMVPLSLIAVRCVWFYPNSRVITSNIVPMLAAPSALPISRVHVALLCKPSGSIERF